MIMGLNVDNKKVFGTGYHNFRGLWSQSDLRVLTVIGFSISIDQKKTWKKEPKFHRLKILQEFVSKYWFIIIFQKWLNATACDEEIKDFVTIYKRDNRWKSNDFQNIVTTFMDDSLPEQFELPRFWHCKAMFRRYESTVSPFSCPTNAAVSPNPRFPCPGKIFRTYPEQKKNTFVSVRIRLFTYEILIK
jgi:hypothetical protein